MNVHIRCLGIALRHRKPLTLKSCAGVAIALSSLLLLAFSGRVLAIEGEGMRLRAAGRLGASKLSCHARAARSGATVSEACLERAQAWFLDVFTAGAPCSGREGSAGVMATSTETFVAKIVAALNPDTTASKCAAAKLRVVGRRVALNLACRSRAAQGSSCAAASARLTAAFARAEELGDCSSRDDAEAVRALMDGFLDEAAVRAAAVRSCMTGLDASIEGVQVALSWKDPPPATGLTRVRVLRRLNAPVSGPSDPQAVEVFFGDAGSTTHATVELLPDLPGEPQEYHYAVFGCTPEGRCEAAASATVLRPTLVEALRGGGYVIHWRHASADVCSDQLELGKASTTTVPGWWQSCDANCGSATARQLNEQGRVESLAIGDSFRDRGIPVGRVISSEYCRNFTTAILMDFGPEIELDPAITYFVYDEPNRCAHSFVRLGEVPPAGTNTALIGHAGFSPGCPVLGALAWGEAAIYKPDGTGGSQLIVARVGWREWIDLP